MKTTKTKTGMRDEYDFSPGVKGKYARRYAQGTNVILLDADVAEVFKDSATVNAVLRDITESVRGKKPAPKRTSSGRSLVVREKRPKYGK